MNQRVLKDEINYLIFSDIYQRFSDPGTKRKAFSLLEATIDCMGRKSFADITLEMVAREAGVSRSAIKHYFEDLDALSYAAVKFIRLRFQKLAIDEIQKVSGNKAMIIAYIDSCFLWTDSLRTHAVVWFSFLSQTPRKPKFKALNTVAVQAGEQRIIALLADGRERGEFHFGDATVSAKTLQCLIMGAMMTYVSEDLTDPENFKLSIRAQCLLILGAA